MRVSFDGGRINERGTRSNCSAYNPPRQSLPLGFRLGAKWEVRALKMCDAAWMRKRT